MESCHLGTSPEELGRLCHPPGAQGFWGPNQATSKGQDILGPSQGWESWLRIPRGALESSWQSFSLGGNGQLISQKHIAESDGCLPSMTSPPASEGPGRDPDDTLTPGRSLGTWSPQYWLLCVQCIISTCSLAKYPKAFHGKK